MRSRVGDAFPLVGQDTLIQRSEPVPELADSTRRQVPEVPLRKARVFPADSHLPAERKVVADKNPRASYKAGWIRHVMAVADSDNPSEVSLLTAGEAHRHHTEISGSFVTEGVGFLKDGESAGFELGLDLPEDRTMAEGIPCLGSRRCCHVEEVGSADNFSSAVQKHPTRSLDAGDRLFDDVHSVFFVEVRMFEDSFSTVAETAGAGCTNVYLK